jgi:CRP-like cAMP-binding protein
MNPDPLFLCPICKYIPVFEREMFLKALKYKVKFFKKGERIANQGDVVKSLYILLKGSVKAEMISASGMILNVETIHAPNPLAPAFLFAENNQFPVDVIALEECELMVIFKESVLAQFACNEAFLRGYMTFNSNRVHFLSERLKLLSIKTIKGKLSQYILTRMDHADFTLDENQTALAEYFGVTRPSLSRALSEMIKEEAIRLKRKKGKVLSFEKLKNYVAI